MKTFFVLAMLASSSAFAVPPKTGFTPRFQPETNPVCLQTGRCFVGQGDCAGNYVETSYYGCTSLTGGGPGHGGTYDDGFECISIGGGE